LIDFLFAALHITPLSTRRKKRLSVVWPAGAKAFPLLESTAERHKMHRPTEAEKERKDAAAAAAQQNRPAAARRFLLQSVTDSRTSSHS
jgi:hypothetical protein